MEESVLKLLESGTHQDVGRLLKEFVGKYEKQFTPVGLEPECCDRLWDVIMGRLSDPLANTTHQICLSAIRILSRDKSSLYRVIDSTRLAVIVRLAGLVPEEEALERLNQQINYDVVIEAQKCLSNLVYNSSSIQRMCCNNSCVPGLMCRLKTFRDPELPHIVKYFDMRLLFLLTAFCGDIRPQLRSEYHGLTYLIEILDLSLKTAQEDSEIQSINGYIPCPVIFNDEQAELVNEVLKVLYNLVLHIDKNCPDEEEDSHCLRLISILRSLLLASCRCPEKTDSLHSNTVNLLLVMPPNMYEELLLSMPQASGGPTSPPVPAVVTTQPTAGAMALMEAACFTEVNSHDFDERSCEYDGKDMTAIIQLLDFLDSRLKAPGQSSNKSLMPILTLMVEMVQANRTIRKFVRLRVLPPLRDVSKRPEEGHTLRNKLCTLMTSPLHDLKHLSANFLFILCKESVDRLIKYTGYGNAAGLLASRGLMLGGSKPAVDYSSDSEDSDTEEYERVREMVNPVTGRYEPPRPSPLEGMTDEQKEHEAMKLVNVLDKLTRNNIIQPCRIGDDGKPHPVESVMELQEGMGVMHPPDHNNDDSD
ncbi:synembryn-A isoform X1 [Procambarus clarkii]|uniref:synembryn-A isoform X1 n=2 Tax=Procambarus clarkii TaxID=6728 RepID=UPI001E6762BB|nr:synembryn-A-like [Procambarus clarkii]